MMGLGRAEGWRRGHRRIPGKRLRIIERLKSEGLSNRAIAQRLGVNEKAIRKLLGPSKCEYLEQLFLIRTASLPVSDSPPKIWIAVINVPISVVVVLDLWWSHGIGHYFFLFSIGFWVLFLLGVVPAMSTRPTDDGICQVNYGGRRQIAWNDVIDVKQKGQHIHVSSRNSTIHIWLSLFEDPGAAGSYIFSKLPSNPAAK